MQYLGEILIMVGCPGQVWDEQVARPLYHCRYCTEELARQQLQEKETADKNYGVPTWY